LYDVQLLSESLFNALTLGALAVIGSGNSGRAAAGGLSLGLASLVRQENEHSQGRGAAATDD
jgi:hypothetical protein